MYRRLQQETHKNREQFPVRIKFEIVTICNAKIIMKVPRLLIYPGYLYHVVIYQYIYSEVPQKFLMLSPALTQQGELSNL